MKIFLHLHLVKRNKLENETICCLCECPPKFHCFFVKCSLFDDELICIDCCQHDLFLDDIINKLEAITLKKRTKEEVYNICKECNKRGI